MRTLIFVLLFTVTLSAQHPCDLEVPSAYLINPGEPVAVGFCHSGADDLGRAVTDFRVVLPDRTVSVGVPPKVTAVPNTGGLYLYETAPLLMTASGPLMVIAANPFLTSLLSTPITLSFTTLPPAPESSLLPPARIRVWRQ